MHDILVGGVQKQGVVGHHSRPWCVHAHRSHLCKQCPRMTQREFGPNVCAAIIMVAARVRVGARNSSTEPFASPLAVEQSNLPNSECIHLNSVTRDVNFFSKHIQHVWKFIKVLSIPSISFKCFSSKAAQKGARSCQARIHEAKKAVFARSFWATNLERGGTWRCQRERRS